MNGALRGALIGALVGALTASCASQGAQRRPRNAIDVQYRIARRDGAAPARVLATSVYRDGLRGSLYAQCAMAPTDSVGFDWVARRCGTPRAVFWGASRVLRERAASPTFFEVTRLEGRVRYVDLPTEAACE